MHAAKIDVREIMKPVKQRLFYNDDKNKIIFSLQITQPFFFLMIFVSSIPFANRIERYYDTYPNYINSTEFNATACFRPAKIKSEKQVGTFKALEKNHCKHQRVNNEPMDHKIKQRHFAVHTENICEPVFHAFHQG